MNHLKNQTSPYLLQHVNNPVDWYPWGEEALSKAKKENKLLLISIGYSACHWCHVMEHESFEDEAVATIMNEHFVCIKVDREERPDIDQIYMNAVQLMTGSGGWPLNCIALPDQRPIYGGTYFKKEDWKKLLFNLADFYQYRKAEAQEYAQKLTEGIRQSEIVATKSATSNFTKQDIRDIYEPWKSYFDFGQGGHARAPKFPLPNNFQFLLRYVFHTNDESANAIVRLTLDKMAWGGIYDQLGGGFSRYSVDADWHVPHFEKMLYDNAQLVSLYSEAYQYCKSELYKQVVYETLEFVDRELTHFNGGFFSALDADSEGVEGKFYCWSKAELRMILGEDEHLFSLYYNVLEHGNWEDTNILMRRWEEAELANKLGLDISELRRAINLCKRKLMLQRDMRVRPGLDDKILASWNGLMLKGYVDAYRVFKEDRFLDTAIKNADFILTRMKNEAGLFRNYKEGRANINGFLDDYAFVIEGLIALYQATFEIKWLLEAKSLVDFTILNFMEKESGMFYFTSQNDEELIARKMELMDNVIPASNSSLAKSIRMLGLYFDDSNYEAIALNMLATIKDKIKTYGSAYSNWAMLLQTEAEGWIEIAITGSDWKAKRLELDEYYLPNAILLGGEIENLPLLEGKVGKSTQFYVCKNKTCQLPVTDIKEVLNLL